MAARTQIEARCPWCGVVPVQLGDCTCGLDETTGTGLCEFACPSCDRLVLLRLERPDVKVLLLLGAAPMVPPAPYELLESHSGPAISWDEVLDLHWALERLCCPQEQLTRHSGRAS